MHSAPFSPRKSLSFDQCVVIRCILTFARYDLAAKEKCLPLALPKSMVRITFFSSEFAEYSRRRSYG
jgi:hypothetical protein